MVDDGSSAEHLLAEFRAFPLRYCWRSNDQCPARSRNQGAALAQSDLLIFIDSDILLNPEAVVSYVNYLQGHANYLLYGYVGTEKTAQSLWFPEVEVNWWDKRFDWQEGLVPQARLFHSAYECAFAGNFAIYRKTFAELGGFDERFTGWGGEDLEFAERAVRKGLQVHFLIDAWAEHQVHARNDAFHRLPSEKRGYGYHFRPHPTMPYAVQCFSSPQAFQQLEQTIQSHYLHAV